MPKAIHQKSLICKQLKKHLPLLLENVTKSRDFLEYYKDVYHYPKMLTNRNIRKYNKMIHSIQFLLSSLDDEVKKAI